MTTIGDYAFSGCRGLTSIKIPNSVASIGISAFAYCSGLTSVTIPNSVTTIGYETFYGCSSLTSVTIPNSVTTIASRAFAVCSGLTSVNIPENVTTIGVYAFYGCSSLTSIEIPNSVTSIRSSVFSNCSSLTSVTIPNSVTKIGDEAFYNCSSLTSVIIPNSVTSIGGSAFSGCSGLTSVTIPNSVTSIGSSVFSNCSSLTSLTIPNSVTSIGSGAFGDCRGLTSVTIGNSVTSIGISAFAYCSGLTSVTIPNSVTSIGSRTFEGCSGMTSVTIGNSVTAIGDYAFLYCDGLTSVTIGNSVTSIGSGAFDSCSGLTSVTINSNSIISNTSSESNLKNIFGSQVKSYIIGDGVTHIGSYAFYNCSGLTSVTIGNSVTSIGSGAFYGCSGLTSVTIPNSVTKIGSYAFAECSGLSTVTLPDDLVFTGDNAFPNKSTMKLYVNIGSKTLLALWNEGYDYVYDDIETQNRLQPSSSLYLSSSTQTSLTINIDSKYSGYTFTCDGNNIGSGGITKTGLYPGQSQSFSITVKKDDLSHSFSEEFRTKDIAPIVSGIVSASSIKATGSYTKGDAVVTKTVIKCNGKEIEGDNLSVCGLTPNKSYTVDYIITVQGNKTYEDSKTFKTSELTMTTEQPKVVSVGNVIVSAKANVDDAETNVGFEWRRTDWTDEFKSNTGTAYMYEGTMEGYIRNLNAEKLWKFRPYYLADDGTYYYGDWMGLDPTNTSYFEPTVHTYANINVEGNTALVKGYALGGTDKITVQGFKYWKAANLAPSGDLALEARKASPAIPADAETIEAEGRVMEATLSGLDYECTYSYVAFAKTDEGTFYGEVKTFTTGPNTTGIEVVRDADSETKAVDDKVKGIALRLCAMQTLKLKLLTTR